MTSSRPSPWPIRLIAMACLLLLGAMPAAPPEDAGHVAFVRQAVPKLLGRKPKGAEEIKVLADLAALVGREALVRALMEEPEFIDHWTNILADDLRVQRDASAVTVPLSQCFGDPMRGTLDPALATHVKREPLTAAAPGGAFNMVDLIRSALVLDDLSPVYRAYPTPMITQVNRFAFTTEQMLVAAIGSRFSQTALNRSPECFTCHNTRFSTTGITGQTGPNKWPRTHPIRYDLEAAVYGSSFFVTGSVDGDAYPIFRYDQFEGNSGPPLVAPWGLTGCGEVRASLAGLPPRQAAMAGLSGTQIGIADLAQAFKDGVDSLAATGPTLTPPPPLKIPPRQALAYLTAIAVAENVWREATGERLTIAHTYPRNIEQRDALIELGERTFLASGWSLKTLLVRIMTSDFFNRRSPDLGGGSTAYQLPMIFDPWVADDPRRAPPPPPLDPKELANGQGDLVHRATPASLLYSVSSTLGWPHVQRFPVGSGFASTSLVQASGQYISESDQGRRGIDFQGLLVWENALALCAKPEDVRIDWIDRLMAEIPSFDAANPARPATVADVVSTTKDWLIGDARIGTAQPAPAPGSTQPLPSERELLAGLIGAPLDTAAASVAGLAGKLRAYCGVLLKSPQFMLAGIDAAGGQIELPRLRACNGAPCSYAEMCASYATTLARAGRAVDCGGATPMSAVRQPMSRASICVGLAATASSSMAPASTSAWPTRDCA